MVHGVTQNCPPISLSLAVLYILEFIGFEIRVLLENEVHFMSLKLSWLNTVLMKTQQENIIQVMACSWYLECSEVYINPPYDGM